MGLHLTMQHLSEQHRRADLCFGLSGAKGTATSAFANARFDNL
jgi:hypothetical protein